jgi:hypothetical protein
MRVDQHRLRQVSGGAVRGEPDHRLQRDEGQGEPEKQRVAAGTALGEVDEHRRSGRAPDPQALAGVAAVG